jgi:hypothetical protein
MKVIEFVKSPGDRLTTARLRFEPSGETFSITLDFLPVADGELGLWAMSMVTTNGEQIVSLVVALQGNTAEGRPPGAIIPYNPASSDDPRRNAFYGDGFDLVYSPDGYDPADFAISPSPG